MGIKKLIKNSSVYSIISLLQKGTNFLLIPVLTLYLTTDDYGIVAVVMTINAFLNVFYLMAMHGSLNRFYYEHKEDETLIKKLFGTIVTFVLINSVVLTIIIYLGRNFLLKPFLDEINFYPYMLLGLVSVLFNPCYTIFQNSLQAKQNGRAFGKNNMLFFVTNLTLLLVGVIVFNKGAIGVLGALAVTNVIFFIYSLVSFRKEITFGIDVKILKKVFKYSFPIMPHTLSGVATNFIDRILINKLLSTASAGIYSIGNNFGSIIFLLASAINQAFVPWFNQAVKEEKTETIPLISKSLVLFYCFIALALSFFGKEIIKTITPEVYHDSWQVIPFISFAFVYHGVYYFFAGSLFYDITGRGNRIIPISTISAAILNIILNLYLIPKYGINGAAIATLITKIALTVSLKFVYRKYLKLKYPELFLLLTPLVFFNISLLSFFNEFSLVSKILVYLVLLSIVAFLLRRDIKSVIKEFKR